MRESSAQVAERAKAMLAELQGLGDYNDTVRFVRELAELVAELAEATGGKRRTRLYGASSTASKG
jgi:hypothetical protein